MVKEWCCLLEGGRDVGRERVASDFSVCATVDKVPEYSLIELTDVRKFHFPLLNACFPLCHI